MLDANTGYVLYITADNGEQCSVDYDLYWEWQFPSLSFHQHLSGKDEWFVQSDMLMRQVVSMILLSSNYQQILDSWFQVVVPFFFWM